MGFTHYYYTLDRHAADGVLDLTWGEFLQKFGWQACKEDPDGVMSHPLP
jgi:hypothetical protein